jgi:hypothetical protein
MRRSIALLVLALGISGFGGCFYIEVREGAKAFTDGSYEKSLNILEPFALHYGNQDPVFTVSLNATTPLPKAVFDVTSDYFMGWYAYVGAHLGLNRMEKGCEWLQISLRPIRFRIDGTSKIETLDPRSGDFWPEEVQTLLTWQIILPCAKLSSERLSD